MRLLTSIPHDADGIVIQYDPNWRVTCAVQERKRALTTSYGQIELEIPAMIFTQTMAPNLQSAKTYYNVEMKGVGYNVMMLRKSEDDRILGSAWPIGTHTCDNGSICWGPNTYPKDLRSAFQQFWQSRFNWEPEYDNADVKKDFSARFELKCFRMRDLTFRIMGKKNIVCNHPVDMVLISSEKEDLALAPEAAIDGPSIPAPDLFDWGRGGYGADKARTTPTDMEWAADEIRHYLEKGDVPQIVKTVWIHNTTMPKELASLVPIPKEVGKVLVGTGTRRMDDKYVIQFEKTSLVYDPATDKLTKD